MKAFEGFKAEASRGGYPMLPAGAYQAVVNAVKIDGNEPDQTLVIRVDITDGEFTGYFKKRYDNDKSNSSGKYEPRYKGDYRLRIPNPANTKALYPESDLKRFNDAMWRFEKSNDGFHWDWNEQKLVGLKIGINMQEGTYNGNPYTVIGRLEDVNDVKNGICEKMKPRKPKGDTVAAETIDPQSGFTQVEDADVPW